MAKLAPLHPGEVLREEFLVPMGLTAYALADHCHIPRTRIERIVNEQNGISADTALRLAKAFGTTPEFWLNLQARYAVEVTKPKIMRDLDTIEMAPTAKAA
jgi:addiction module HigA family antidote